MEVQTMLVKYRPFNSVINHEHFLEDFFNNTSPVKSTSFEPRVDIKETEKNFEINAELPGLSKEDFKLTTEENFLTLEGEKKYEDEVESDSYHRSERRFGAFKRVFRLTDAVDRKKIKADFNSGILKILLAKSKKAEPKEVEISVN